MLTKWEKKKMKETMNEWMKKKKNKNNHYTTAGPNHIFLSAFRAFRVDKHAYSLQIFLLSLLSLNLWACHLMLLTFLSFSAWILHWCSRDHGTKDLSASPGVDVVCCYSSEIIYDTSFNQWLACVPPQTPPSVWSLLKLPVQGGCSPPGMSEKGRKVCWWKHAPQF